MISTWCSVRWNILCLLTSRIVMLISFRENLFEEMLQEKEDIAVKRKRCKEILRVLQQAAWVLNFLPSANILGTILFTL